MKLATTITLVLLTCVALAHAGVRADLSGDAVVDFQTTMDMPFMTVGNAGNAPDSTGFGAVDYEYNIAKFEVTAGQYTEFLNAVATTDTYGLYDDRMWSSHDYGCRIERNGSAGSYTYSIWSTAADRPVNWIDWGDAARFCNWLTNGMPSGGQSTNTTESGSYSLNGANDSVSLMTITRDPDARYAIPTADEWYKAAYHANDGPTDNYFDYPTGTDTMPNNINVDPDSGNNATFRNGGNFTDNVSPFHCTEAGEFENSVSPYGTFDMGGNVHEWGEDPNAAGTWRGFRGGAFLVDGQYLAASSGPHFWSPRESAHTVGFRVVQILGRGDFDGDGDTDADDLDVLIASRGSSNMSYDLTGNGVVDQDDVDEWVFNIVSIGENIGTVYGDFNLNGEVDASDLTLLATTYGTAGDWGWASGDGNGDGKVDVGDLALLAANYGTIVHPIPEPATMGLLAMGVVVLLKRRRA